MAAKWEGRSYVVAVSDHHEVVCVQRYATKVQYTFRNRSPPQSSIAEWCITASPRNHFTQHKRKSGTDSRYAMFS
jgi:hypothetical protein